jgi:heme oxygenase
MEMTSLPLTLREETRALHDAVDRALPLMKATLTRDEYIDVLARMHAWWSPTERLVPDLLAEDFAVPLRARAGDLRADLNTLGIDIPPDAADAALPALNCAAHAVGCLYVLEGSSLGAPFISRHLVQTLGVTPDQGGSFFAVDQIETRARWHQVRAALEEYPAADASLVVEGAQRTFSSLLTWLT